MKKYLLILFVTCSTYSFAQTNVSFGIRGGLSSSGMRGDALNNLSSLLDFTNGMVKTTDRTGLYGGVYANIPLDDKLSFEPGIYYTQKGYNLTGELNVKGLEFLGANAKAQLQSQYVDIPVLLKLNLGQFQVFAGPQVSYLMKADLRTTAGLLGFNVLDKKLDATSQFNRWDAGVTGGIGFNFSKNVNLTASYDYGLQKVDANKNINAFNRGIKVGIGVSF